MERDLRQLIQHGVAVWDGATGTQYQARNLTASDFDLALADSPSPLVAAARERVPAATLEGCPEVLNMTRPDVVAEVYRAYFDAGSDIVETNTFGVTSVVLADYEIPELVRDLSFSAAVLARRVADEFTDRPRYVAGALGPGTKLISLGQVSWDEVVATYADAYEALLTGGADLLLLETMQDLLMVKAGVIAARSAMRRTEKVVPLVVQFTIEQTGTMLLGTEVEAAITMLEAFPEVTAIGMNCATGPAEMAPFVKALGELSTRPISIQPNAGLPLMEHGQAVYKLTPGELAEHHARFVRDHGVSLVGGCCGTTPGHIAEVRSAVQEVTPSDAARWRFASRYFPGLDFTLREPEQAEAFALVGSASLYQFQPHVQDNSVLVIGEKTNANGSKAFREMLAAENWDGLVELARELEGEGSHVLDVCTAYVGRDESADLRRLLYRYNLEVTVPLMIDSTEVDAIEVALKCLAGKPIVNSINFEDGDAKAERVLGLCRDYGAAVVALTIDESGMAKSVDHKLAVAERLIKMTRRFGLPDHDVFIDCLTFTLGSGDEEFRRAGIDTLAAIRGVRERFPRVNTVLGVSNISFGLRPAARTLLNSAFLHFAIVSGLTSAIVHASKIVRESEIVPDLWKVAADLVHDRREFAAL